MSYTLHIGVIVLALILSAALGSPIVRLAFRWAKIPNGAKKSPDSNQDPGTDTPEAPPELLRGGQTIGVLERLAVTGLLLLSYPTGIAAIVAIKGLGRFHELKGPHGALASEKFVIGTLMSYLWAGLMAVIAIAILPLI